jgi:CTP:molybdopterin cytidylyltransferase MocA
MFTEILSWNGPGGLQSFLKRQEARACEVELKDKGILMGFDTPADYSEISHVYEQRNE